MANLIESAISFVSPKWGAERAYYRQVLATHRAYEAAKSGRRTDGWQANGASANAEIGPAVSRLRARARDMARNSEIGSNAVRKLAAHMIGTGISPRLVSENKHERRAFADRYRAFSENCDPDDMTDMGGKQHEIAQTVVESGEALIRFLPRPSKWRMQVPLQIQVLEPDYVDFAKNEVGNDGAVIIQGVEYDGWGRRVATWMFDEHPGEVWPLGKNRLQSKRYTMDQVRPVFHRLRPGQVHGVPWFAPVVMRMRDAGDYEEAEHLRKLTETCFAAFVKRPAGPAASSLKGDARDGSGRPITKITPGMVRDLAPGEEVTFSQPASAGGAVDYLSYQWRVVAAGLGLPYSTLTGDLSNANYSSQREGKIDFWQLLDVWQWLMVIPQACRPVLRQVDAAGFAAGGPSFQGRPVSWATPARPWVDPLKDVVGAVKSMRAGLADPRAMIAERTGEDPDDVIASVAAFNKLLDELGVVLDSDGRRVTAAGVAQFTDPLNPGGDNA